MGRQKTITSNEVKRLESWFVKSHRPLPWRKTQDPYSIWISEVMLQQTQVATVIPYYEKFLKRLPTLKILAAAPTDTVLSLWSGLGYYSRAKNLQKGAQYILKNHGAVFPKDRELLLLTPGIGPYTAGAILSIAFDLRVPLVDGNVQRVFARYYAWPDAIETKKSQAFFWTKAQAWVDESQSPRALNQALMELGSTVCVKGKPRCDFCPVAGTCQALKKGITETLPVRKPKREKVDLYWLALRYEKGDSIFLARNATGEWWENLWDLPRHVFSKQGELNDKAEEILLADGTRRLGVKRHAVTHHRLHVTGISLPVTSRSSSLKISVKGQWFSRRTIFDLPLSSLARKVLMLE